MKKIDFRKPKYIIPAIILLPLSFLVWNVINIFSFEKEEINDKQIVEGSINIEMPKANLDGYEIKNKHETMLEDVGKKAEHVGVQIITQETKNGEQIETIYTKEELRKIDSIESLQREKWLENIIGGYERQEEKIIEREEKEEDVQMGKIENFIKNNFRTEKDVKEEDREKEKKRIEERQRKILEKKKEPLKVVLEKNNKATYFNTIGEKEEEEDSIIEAVIDEKIKVYKGSRIRLRILENIKFGRHSLKKGSYLFAIVNGFREQRMIATVESILIDKKIVKVSLIIYDNDGLEGVFIPDNKFRELSKDAGANALGTNINMSNNTTEQNIQSVALQTLQNVYQSTANAIGTNIRKNKANLKYNTIIYLVNKK